MDKTYHVQLGSSGTLRVSNESKFYVVRETWDGNRLANVKIMSKHDLYRDAEQERERLAFAEYAKA